VTRWDGETEDLLRILAPQVLGALVRRYGHFDTAEDAVQDALLAAARQWPDQGRPDDPRAWLIQVGARRLVDALRSDASRRAREEADARLLSVDDARSESPEPADDSLVLLFLCVHPALARPAQVALTLRAVGGLTTSEIAAAFLVPETTMAQRITRAKQTVRRSGVPFRLPTPEQRPARLAAVLQVLYLIFNEGYVASSGPDFTRVELGAEALRLTRLAHRLMPDEGEVAGLLALILLTEARREARTGDDAVPIPLDQQDRDRWDREAVAEGTTLLTATMARHPAGPYQLQAAIAALHDEAEHADDTDWTQILALYGLLEHLTDSPVVTLNRAVAVAMVHGPEHGLAVVERIATDPRLDRTHRIDAVRAHLHERAGRTAQAARHYREAARRATSTPEQRYLHARAVRLEPD